ncbi:MAG: HYR domain-containing protein, partial [Flavobacteriales bacterium]|nr:HYR domain-containing protein [Flavobacteriales bacterium]
MASADNADNVSDSATINVDGEAPEITCPETVTVDCADSTSPSNTGYPETSDNCNGDVEFSYEDEVSVSTCPIGQTISRTWTATDEAGNTAQCTQEITVLGGASCSSDISCQANDAISIGNDEVTFAGVRYDYPQPGQSTWYYCVESGSSPALSHFNFGLSEICIDDYVAAGIWSNNGDNLGGGGSPSYGVDGSTGFFGLKFDQGFNSGESRQYYFTVEGNFLIGSIDGISKGGSDFDVASIPGPITSCEEIQPVQLVCPDDIDGVCDAVVEYELPEIIGDCSAGASLELIEGFESGSEFPVGTTTVTYQVTDQNGFTAECSFDVTVLPSTESTEEITACDSYEWKGELYESSGTYTFDTLNVAGCDSTITLNLTINESTESSEEITACDSYEWKGELYESSGTYTFDTLNVAGCDSTITLDLTINESTESFDELTACDSYEWNGEVYTESGNYEAGPFENAAGCDSIANLALTINESTESFDELTACDSYEWNGEVYTETGNYQAGPFENAAGCDSIANLALTINESTESFDEVTACDSYEWNGVTYTESGNYEAGPFENTVGCDSIANLALTINESTESFDEVTACDSYEWNGEVYTESG